MIVTTARWPFLPEEQRTPEQNERWWAECYVPSPAEAILRGIAHSVIVYGGPGSGKTVSLNAFERMETEHFLIVHYPITRWPGESLAWSSTNNHLGQIMACASIAIKELLTYQPEKLKQLTLINLEYMRWLIEKYSGRRAFRRWADTIDYQALLDLLVEPFDDLYPTDTNLPDVQGQIEELVTLSRRLGFEGVIVLIDVNEHDVSDRVNHYEIKELFRWLPPLQFQGFGIKAAFPEPIVEKNHLIDLTRGRVKFSRLEWTSEECYQVGDNHLQAATDNRLHKLTNIATPELLVSLETELERLYNGYSLQAWVWLTETLLNRYTSIGQRLTNRYSKDLIRTYFANYVPLKFDKNEQGVWRGPQFIELDEQPYRFLRTLFQYKRGIDANQALLEVAGSQGNLNTIASRVRRRIEPVPGKPIYLHNTRGLGYWLEHVKR